MQERSARARTITTTVVVLAIAAAVGFGGDRLRRRADAMRAELQDPRENLYVPAPSVLERVSLGYRELAADLLWMRALVYFGQYFDAKHDVPWLERYIDGILALTPTWRGPYFWGASVITYQSGQLTDREARKSASYLERGLTRFPADPQMLFLLATRYLTDIEPTSPSEKTWMKLRGAELMADAARQPGAPAFWGTLAARVMSQEGRRELAIASLREQMLLADDETRRATYRKELAKLESEAAAAEAEAAGKAFVDGWKSTAPYASQSLFVLIGARRPGPPFDVDAVVSDPLRPVDDGLSE